MRRFVLVRDLDVSGISGEGVVVWGIQWPDGRVSYRWNTPTATSTAADSIDDVRAVHGHNGATRVEWLDSERGGKRWQRYVWTGRPTGPMRGEQGAPDGGTAG